MVITHTHTHLPSFRQCSLGRMSWGQNKLDFDLHSFLVECHIASVSRSLLLRDASALFSNYRSGVKGHRLRKYALMFRDEEWGPGMISVENINLWPNKMSVSDISVATFQRVMRKYQWTKETLTRRSNAEPLIYCNMKVQNMNGFPPPNAWPFLL